MQTRITGTRGYPREISEIEESVENAKLIHNAIVTNIATLDTGTAGWSQTSTDYDGTINNFSEKTTRNNDAITWGKAFTGLFEFATKITTTASKNINKVDMWVNAKFGSPSGNYTIEIWSDSAGTPGTIVNANATSTIAGGSLVASSWNTFTLTDEVVLPAGDYWIMNLSTEASATNFWYISADYSGLSLYRRTNGGAWSSQGSSAINYKIYSNDFANYNYENGNVTDFTRWNTMKADIEAIEAKLPALETDLKAAQVSLTDTIYGDIDTSTITSYTIPTFTLDSEVPTIDNWNDLASEVQEVLEKLNRYYSFAYYLVDDVLAGAVTLPTGFSDSAWSPSYTATVPNQTAWADILTKYNGSFLFDDFLTSHVANQTVTTKGRYLKVLYKDTDNRYRAAVVDFQTQTQLTNVFLDGFALPTNSVITATDFNTDLGTGAHTVPGMQGSTTYYTVTFDSSNNVYVTVALISDWTATNEEGANNQVSLIWYGDYYSYKFNSSGAIQYTHSNLKNKIDGILGTVTTGDVTDTQILTISAAAPSQASFVSDVHRSVNIITIGQEPATSTAPELRWGIVYLTDDGTTLSESETDDQVNCDAETSIATSDYSATLGKFFYNTGNNIVYSMGLAFRTNAANTEIQAVIATTSNGTLTARTAQGETLGDGAASLSTGASQYVNWETHKVGLVANADAGSKYYLIVSEFDPENETYSNKLNRAGTAAANAGSCTVSQMYDVSDGNVYTWLKGTYSEDATSSFFEYILESTDQAYTSATTYSGFDPLLVTSHIDALGRAVYWDATNLYEYTGTYYDSDNQTLTNTDQCILPVTNKNDRSSPFTFKCYQATIAETDQMCGTVIENSNKETGTNSVIRIRTNIPAGTPAPQKYIVRDYDTS